MAHVNLKKKMRWIPHDAGAWPDDLPRYEEGADTVIHFPNGKTVDLATLPDPFVPKKDDDE